MSEPAENKFYKGQTVQTTKEAIDWGAVTKKKTGIIVGFPISRYSEDCVIVQEGVAGLRHVWHMNFWEPL